MVLPAKGAGRSRRTRKAPATARRPGLRFKLWLTFGERTLFGEGKAELLDLVDRLGSLHRAAAAMEMSYRYAWGLLRELESAAELRFLDHRGRGPRARLSLTPEGRAFVDAYRAFRSEAETSLRARFARAFATPPAKAPPRRRRD